MQQIHCYNTKSSSIYIKLYLCVFVEIGFKINTMVKEGQWLTEKYYKKSLNIYAFVSFLQLTGGELQ